jgi:hypothetical protein
MKHLRPELLPMLELPDKERIKYIKNERWIGYSRAKYVLNRLEELLEHPTTHRMPNILIVGDTNNGKTVIVNKFEKQYPPRLGEEEDGLVIPVLLIQAPPVPDEKRFFNNILDKLVVPYRINDRVERKQQQVIHILKKVKLKILVIDEIHHILAGSSSRQRSFLNVLKFISNELQISLVGVGTREALNAIQTDQQLSNRFEPLLLPKWHMNEEYLRLLASFELMIPLKKPSHLTSIIPHNIYDSSFTFEVRGNIFFKYCCLYNQVFGHTPYQNGLIETYNSLFKRIRQNNFKLD